MQAASTQRHLVELPNHAGTNHRWRRHHASANFCVAHRTERHGQARLADGADAAWPDRDDDERSRSLGRLGNHIVAAVALAHTTLFGAFMIGMGVVSAVAPLAAQAYGAREPRMVRRALRVGPGLRQCSACRSASASSTARNCCSRSVKRSRRQGLRKVICKARLGLVPAWWFIAIAASRAPSTARSRGSGSRSLPSQPICCWPTR